MGKFTDSEGKVYLTIYNPNTYNVRVRITDKTLLRITPKTSISTGVSRKYFKRLKRNPSIYLHKAVPYESFLQVLKKNRVLKNKVAQLQKELSTQQQAGVVGGFQKNISELLNLALEKIADKGKLAIFQALIEENLKLREV